LDNAGALPWDLRAWSGIDALRARVNAHIRAVLHGETGEIAVAEARGRRPWVRTVRSSKRRHPGRFKATTQPTPISDRAAIQKNKDQ
jgi:hypothetical protein